MSFSTGGNGMRLSLFSRMLFKFRKPQSVSTDSSHISETTSWHTLLGGSCERSDGYYVHKHSNYNRLRNGLLIKYLWLHECTIIFQLRLRNISYILCYKLFIILRIVGFVCLVPLSTIYFSYIVVAEKQDCSSNW